MNRILLQIKVLSSDMGKSEKKIAEWILTHPREILPLSISELAELSGSSEATIVRFSRRLGLSGYQELKISIAQESGAMLVNETITRDDTCFEIFDKSCNDIFMTLEKTKRVLSEESLTKAADLIMNANRILVFGLGNSASIAIDASHKLLRAGCHVYAYTDNHMQAIAASQLSPGDVAIGISYSGSSRDIVEALKLSRERGAATIALTQRGKSPITKQADISLFTDSNESKFNFLALSSRIAQLAVIDALYFYIVYHKTSTLEAIQNTERSLLSKKY